MKGRATRDLLLLLRELCTRGPAVKLRRVTANNRKRQFDVTTRAGRVLALPYTKLDPGPTPENLVREAFVHS